MPLLDQRRIRLVASARHPSVPSIIPAATDLQHSTHDLHLEDRFMFFHEAIPHSPSLLNTCSGFLKCLVPGGVPHSLASAAAAPLPFLSATLCRESFAPRLGERVLATYVTVQG
jgi:hypothetical protein